jgi:hypothetical protein
VFFTFISFPLSTRLTTILNASPTTSVFLTLVGW